MSRATTPSLTDHARTPANKRRPRRAPMRLSVFLLCMLFFVPPGEAGAQDYPTRGEWLAGAGVVVGVALFDGPLQNLAQSLRTPALDPLADAGDFLGRGKHLNPAMATSLVLGYAIAGWEGTVPVLRVIAGYTIGNVVVSSLKGGVGRGRPYAVEDPYTFRPMTLSGGEWHSFSSGHTVHAFALASGISEEVGNPWVTATTYSLASLVGLSRMYHNMHWASDVLASALIGHASGRITVRYLRHRFGDSRHLRLRVMPHESGMLVGFELRH